MSADKRVKGTHEQWVSKSDAILLINKYDERGYGKTQDIIRKNQPLVITSEERKILNSSMILDPAHDPFKNGDLVPVTLASDSDDLEENPNHMSEDDVKAIFDIRNHLQFKAAVDKISSVPILTMMRNMAMDDEVNATVKQAERIEERLEEVVDAGDFIVNEVVSVGVVNTPGIDKGPDTESGVTRGPRV